MINAFIICDRRRYLEKYMECDKIIELLQYRNGSLKKLFRT